MAIKNNYPTIRPSLDLNFAGSKVVDPRVTFTRPSTATYYDGKTVEIAEENLLKWSQDFTNAVWIRYQANAAAPVVVSNFASAPDGSFTASKITFGATTSNNFSNSRISQNIATPVGSYTRSVYIKAASAEDVGKIIYFHDSGYAGTLRVITLTADWQRVVVNVTGSDSQKQFALSVYGVGYGGISQASVSALVWGAQVERRDQATAYTPTTDQPITRYQPVLMTAAANTPRIDHDPITGECKGLLVEPQRTNLLLNSDVLATQAVVVAAAAHTLSFFSTGTVTLSGAATGTLTGSSSSARSVLTFTPTAGTLTLTVTGNCTLSQLEAGDSATSYIRTEGSQATRAADSIQVNGLGQIGAGTIYVDAAVRNGNTLVTSGMTTAAATASTRQNTAVAYDLTSTRQSINGEAVTSAGGTQGGSNISIAPGATGWISKLSIYPQKFGDAHLQALTA